MATKANALKAALASDTNFVKEVQDVHQDIKDWVEGAFKAWQADENSWRSITFATVSDMDEIMEDARRYTNVLRDPALTIQTSGKPEQTPDGVRLVYRVRTKVHSGRKPRNGGS